MNAWLDEFKIAVINSNIQGIINLHEKLPPDLDLESMQKAKNLFDSAIAVLECEQEKTLKALESLRKSKEYAYSHKSNTGAFDNKS